MAFSWDNIKLLLTFLGPILVPKAIKCYRDYKSTHSSTRVRPLPSAVLCALLLLLAFTLYYISQTLPNSSPEEVFSITHSRLQIPNDVLFARLSAIRPEGLTESDKILKSKFHSLDSRLLYLQYGPKTLIDCTFCRAEDPKSYFYYSIPSLLFPHLFNLALLGFITSGLFIGKHTSVWRTQVSIAAIGLSIIDLYLTFSFPYRSNSRAKTFQEVYLFFWKARTYRFFALACLDWLIGILLYLSSTQRAFLNPLSVSEKVDSLVHVIDATRSKVIAIGVVQNTIVRNQELRDEVQQYWMNEVQLTQRVMEEKEVVDSVKNALESRIDMDIIVADAHNYVQNIMKSFYERTRPTVEGS
ncbi:putative chorismate synthase protein [Golovinomyces cichoracearum]|uniref:Putative chorismate synthase protein n=1 Tax=Golovinomyces cichoracearum TaxID=62708 RepID=A0A420HGK8_9PEZI|nr:putative chorismate synthase protein [Golovinomyces cichoracearum]